MLSTVYLARHHWIVDGKDGLYWPPIDQGPPLPKPTPAPKPVSYPSLSTEYRILGNTWNAVTFDKITLAGIIHKAPERSLWDVICRATVTCNGVAVLGNTGKYIIQRVTMTRDPGSPSGWMYRVEFGGRLLGIPDLLQALVSAQQKTVKHEARTVDKFHQETDTLVVSDEFEYFLSKRFWVCGDPDAICGFVEVNSDV